ncbi:hypothetical protein H6F98_19100 [Microcoleus sp. FACHB-SPT15]|uniref:hypothetical protein n=1 Tax=Microcoleus sp. FACHB-SPT15 TaxID=2692830 RepID=UPI0017828CED|nr:hypothetical protein [Microcoleus sp. FACHB-SPT15]MBD1807535.1 hypothetical protein [Microcoleus sp. FACHB-SPT15]
MVQYQKLTIPFSAMGWITSRAREPLGEGQLTQSHQRSQLGYLVTDSTQHQKSGTQRIYPTLDSASNGQEYLR